MPPQDTVAPPFFTWLLGPGWSEAGLYQPAMLAVFIVLLCGGLVAGAIAMRKGSAAISRKTAILLAGGILGAIVLLGALALLLWLFPVLRAPLAGLLGTGWHRGALFQFAAVVVCLGSFAFAVGWLAVAVQRGPEEALARCGRVVGEAAFDLICLSPRRVWALTWLTVKEAVRRRMVVAFAVFIVCLLFAGWFLDPGSGDPARLYLGFVLTTTTYLVLLLAWFLSTASLPADIKKRTLFTVITKPVRRSEIVLGRMLGFVAVGTGLLLIMGPISYVFVVRGLAHTHELPDADRETAEQLWNLPPETVARKGPQKLTTDTVNGHKHTIYLNPLKRVLRDGRAELETAAEGSFATQPEQGHWHAFSYETSDEEQPDGKVMRRLRTKLGPVLGRPIARVPIFGDLRFKDREGRDARKGISVGDEWEYRSFIQGGTRAAAIWSFQDIREEDFPDGIRVEMTIEIFRSHKGDIEKGVLGSLWVRRPAADPKVENWVEVRSFEAKEFVTDVKLIPRDLETPAGEQLDLFRDIVADGKLELRLTCEVPNQYFGAAPHDLYLRTGDAPFAWNFAKGYLGIWLQMVLVVCFGVMFSTFLSAPIAMLATMAMLLGGTFWQFIKDLGSHKVVGGGPGESLYRMVNQDNLVSEMPPGLRTTLLQMGDVVLEMGLRVVTRLLPDFGSYAFLDDQGHACVASGFDISTAMVAKAVLSAASFAIPLFVAGYFFLKTREVAR